MIIITSAIIIISGGSSNSSGSGSSSFCKRAWPCPALCPLGVSHHLIATCQQPSTSWPAPPFILHRTKCCCLSLPAAAALVVSVTRVNFDHGPGQRLAGDYGQHG
jgi:hypothetical protein